MSVPRPEVRRLVLGPLQTNCYLVACPETLDALVIDPADSSDRILREIERQKLRVTRILLTHGHPDHVGAAAALREATGAQLLLHDSDARLLEEHGHFYGIPVGQLRLLEPDSRLKGGEELMVGNMVASVIHTPGHTPGSVTLRLADVLFTGDTLFAQGVGRVDLPGGNLDMLLESLRRLFTLPERLVVYPGHGPSTTIGEEKRDNPYV